MKILSFFLSIIFFSLFNLYGETNITATTNINQKKKKEKIKFSTEGRISIGMHSIYEIRSDPLSRVLNGKIRFKIKVGKKIRGRIDIEGDVNDPSIRLDELAIIMKPSKNFTFQCGNLKKFFSLEEMTSRRKMITPKRSYYYEYLDNFEIFGRDFSFQTLLYGAKTAVDFFFDFSIDGDFRAFFNSRFQWHNNSFKIGISSMYMYHFNYRNSFFTEIDIKYKKDYYKADFEMSAGLDPQTSIIITSNSTRDKYFLAFKTMQSIPIKLPFESTKMIIPYISLTSIFYDTTDFSKIKIELLPGFTIIFGKKSHLRLMTATGIVWINHDLKQKMIYKEGYVTSVLQLKW